MPIYTNHHLTAEHIKDDHGPAIMLTQQEGIEDPETIVIHPWQLVAACQHLGLTTSGLQAEKTIATLQRRMVALRDRIESLADWMAQFSDHRHADLSHETTQLNALADLSREWCIDFEQESTIDDSATSKPYSNSAGTVSAPQADKPKTTAKAQPVLI